MQFFLLFLSLSLFIFLFVLYWVGKDDLVLLRKGIALEQLFNIIGVALLIGLFTSRLMFVLLHPSKSYLNPLVFLVFPYFPGLSLLGGLLGAGGFLLYLYLKKKLPLGRILDFSSLSLLSALPVGIIGSMFISPRSELVGLFILILIYIFVAAVFFLYLYPKLLQNHLKEGILTQIFLLVLALTQLGSRAFYLNKGWKLFLGGEEIGFTLLLIVSVYGLLKMTVLDKEKKQ